MAANVNQKNSRLRVVRRSEDGTETLLTERHYGENPGDLQSHILECRLLLPQWDPKDRLKGVGGYRVIYADPPWDYAWGGKGIQGCTPYPTMSHEDIKNLPVEQMACRINFGCILFLWATGPKMPEAIDVMQAWGFEYKTVFLVWRKVYDGGNPVCGLGRWTRPNAEFLLVGVKSPTHNSGNLLRDRTRPRCDNGMLQELTTTWRASSASRLDRADQTSGSSAALGHSEKPAEARARIEQFLGLGKAGTTGADLGIPADPQSKEPRPYIELFARTTVPGWDAWGLEVPGFLHRAEL